MSKLDPSAGEVVAREAAQAYHDGNFALAVEKYETAVAGGVQNGHLYYNLGNAYFRAGRMGAARDAYLKAKSLLPRDPDVAGNLALLEEVLPRHDGVAAQDGVDWMEAMLRPASVVTPREWGYIASSSGCLGFLCVSLFLWRRAALFRAVGGVLLVVGLVSGAVAWGLAATQHDQRAVRAPTLEVRSGPSTHDAVLFSIPEGTIFIQEAVRSGWARIRVAGFGRGWVHLESANR